MEVEEAAKWMRAARERIGWSAAQLADRARELAHEANYPVALKQQSISGFENGIAKRMPGWFRFAQQALEQVQISPREELAPQHGDRVQFVSMQVALPSEVALARMFEGLLLPLDLTRPKAELAQMLARRLPTGLSQLQDLQSISDPDQAPSPGAGAQRRAIDHREPPRAPRT